ncbi:YggS family pyridoxal phosphate-dependent enzyme [Helicobacter sp. WB40]|uniref:YggS family pyridoxal phosphate-dependent enzyme n=1 Tax=Helicobacter sp. WB40 TaxID=3004130 RepID=UPI0022EC13B1|nr:YggS family pyridoxal phosphate-dependent enzyme [Helicobacter sp. WB40]MDA3967990.1 YggS family pyridoxal phosphate-dependent enzyme [Helicobacter sp. WB40]
MGLNQNLLEIIDKIEKARISTDRHRIINLVVASKYANTEQIAELYKCGQRAFGENKIQSLQEKSKDLEDIPLEWHFFGTLQSNKINALLRLKPYLIHSLHSYDIALELNKRLARDNLSLRALLQVNSANESSKSGVLAYEAKDIYHKIQETCSNIKLCGLMSIGAHSDDTNVVKRSFETTYKIYEQLDAKILSMGMSNDFELAIKCGSNCLRIGSVLFA